MEDSRYQDKENIRRQNKMQLNGKDIDEPDAYLEINLTSDVARVAGFGQPITAPLAHKMIMDYCFNYRSAQAFITKVMEDKESDLKDDKNFKMLYDLFSPEKHIVSGVFGKESLMQILAQPGCEGIKYVLGKYNGEITVVLLGVEEVEKGVDEEGKELVEAKYAILGGQVFDDCKRAQVHSARGPVIVEVHRASKTVAQTEREIGIRFPDEPEMPDTTTGIY